MSRVLAASPIGLLAFVMALALAAAAVGQGLMTDDAMLLWASSVSASGGDVPVGRIIASYPTLPFLLTTLLELVTPSGTPTPALLASALLALLAATWFHGLRKAGFEPPVAAALALLTALHPAMLAACLAGPAEMCLAACLYYLCTALFDLRARTAAPEVMAVGLALLGLAFSHPIGAAVALAAVPLLAFAVRPSTVARSAFNVMLALIFPTLFSIGAFAYVSWVFPGNGWSFLASPSESLATWAVDASRTFGTLAGSLSLDAALVVALTLALGAPLVPVALSWVRERLPLVVPPMVLSSIVVLAAATTAASGLFGSPAPLAVAAPLLAAAVAGRLPEARARWREVVAWLVAGWVGGGSVLALIEPRAATQLSAAVERDGASRAPIDALLLGHALAGRQGVLVDTGNTPAVVLGRGHSIGLVEPSDPDFTLALLLARIDAPFVAVPDPHSATGTRDQLNKTFPALYRDGSPGYRLVYRNATWRLYARQSPTSTQPTER